MRRWTVFDVLKERETIERMRRAEQFWRIRVVGVDFKGTLSAATVLRFLLLLKVWDRLLAVVAIL